MSYLQYIAMLPKNKKNSSPQACLACREKHLKCDGQTPLCRRCAAGGLACIYVQSRRGQRTNMAKPNTSAQSHLCSQPSPQSTTMTRSPAPPGLGLGIGGGNGVEPQLGLVPGSLPTLQTQQLHNDAYSEETVSMPCLDSGTPDDTYLIGLYYRYVHPAHPFLLPLQLYQQNRGVFPGHLKRAMYFIASHHHMSTEQYYVDSSEVFKPGVTNDAFKVQSLILVTLASYARFERDRGNKALDAAINVACQIGMNSESFAPDDEPLFRESWRRTWWELYTVAGLISLIGSTNTRLSQPVDMTLPYDCEAYEACQTTRMGNCRDIQERFQAESNTKWSSYAFKVEAMRILSLTLDVMNDTSPSGKLAAEAAISGYLLSLPEDNRDGLKPDGDVDEVMSCALMIIHLAGIWVHVPQSPLALVGDFRTVCGNDLGQNASEAPPLHRAAALRSAKALARLLMTHSNLRTLSPCFSCALSYSAAVLLSEYSLQEQPKPLYLSENLQLELSALQSLSQTWPIAGVVRSQIAGFARDILSRPTNSDCVGIPDLDLSLMEDQWLQDLISDDAMLPN
ncbi:hypothetical protein B0I35DRAFT_280512 [Stachybotrys elegans]|uniref:Zn(2)-C6 fungal-type domain-containing protein n=1 Tax=Stachybotrys elegans TaxID=80388 RepID=A0A8K0SSW6_9HYPO|nr:hypothetical protein B0I35DRAFT_280512 [Stachybotrys elegans]